MQRLDLEFFYLRLVGGKADSEIRFSSIELALRECDRLEAELRRDRDPGRWFVYDRHGIPIFAGLEHPESRHQGKRRLGVEK